MTLSEMIKTYIDEHALTYEQFGNMCGLSKGYVSMLIKNKNPKTGKPPVPSVTTYQNIAEALGMSLDDLFRQIDDAPIYVGDSTQEKLNEIGAELTAKTPQIRMVSGNMEHLPQEYQDRIVGYVQALVEEYKNDTSKKEG